MSFENHDKPCIVIVALLCALRTRNSLPIDSDLTLDRGIRDRVEKNAKLIQPAFSIFDIHR